MASQHQSIHTDTTELGMFNNVESTSSNNYPKQSHHHRASSSPPKFITTLNTSNSKFKPKPKPKSKPKRIPPHHRHYSTTTNTKIQLSSYPSRKLPSGPSNHQIHNKYLQKYHNKPNNGRKIINPINSKKKISLFTSISTTTTTTPTT